MYKKIFEITIIRLTMAEIKQFSFIQAFTALWEIQIKEMAAISKSHPICSKIQFSYSCFGALDQFYPNFVHFNEIQYQIWNACHFLIFYLSESCKSLDNREWVYFCHRQPSDDNFIDFLIQSFNWKNNIWKYYHKVKYGSDKTILYYPGFYSSLRDKR